MKHTHPPNAPDPDSAWRLIAPLPETLWVPHSVYARSTDLTPVYIRRFRGPRRSTHLDQHAFWELTCVVGGDGWLLHEQGRTPMQRDMVLLIPPGFRHGESSDDKLDTIWVRVDGQRLKSMNRTAAAGVADAALRTALEQLWLMSEYGTGQPIGAELDGRLAAILSRFFRLLEGHENQAHHDLAERAVIYMTEHLADEINVPGMAGHFNCSEGYLQRVFKRRTGLTLIAYLMQARCRQAAGLLQHTDWSMLAIAAAVGFSDPFYFSRVFRRLQGMNPRAYRQRQRDGAHEAPIRNPGPPGGR